MRKLKEWERAYYNYDDLENEAIRETIVDQARTLSSGTIAALINNPSYTVIDIIQADFVVYCTVFGHRYTTWQDAWKDYDLTGARYYGLTNIERMSH